MRERRGGYCFEQNLLLEARARGARRRGRHVPRARALRRGARHGAPAGAPACCGVARRRRDVARRRRLRARQAASSRCRSGPGEEHEQAGWRYRVVPRTARARAAGPARGGDWADLYAFVPAARAAGRPRDEQLVGLDAPALAVRDRPDRQQPARRRRAASRSATGAGLALAESTRRAPGARELRPRMCLSCSLAASRSTGVPLGEDGAAARGSLTWAGTAITGTGERSSSSSVTTPSTRRSREWGSTPTTIASASMALGGADQGGHRVLLAHLGLEVDVEQRRWAVEQQLVEQRATDRRALLRARQRRCRVCSVRSEWTSTSHPRPHLVRRPRRRAAAALCGVVAEHQAAPFRRGLGRGSCCSARAPSAPPGRSSRLPCLSWRRSPSGFPLSSPHVWPRPRVSPFRPPLHRPASTAPPRPFDCPEPCEPAAFLRGRAHARASVVSRSLRSR